MEAILNVLVKKLAENYQKLPRPIWAYIPINHMYPSSPAVLEINKMTILSSNRHQLIKHTQNQDICGTYNERTSRPTRQYIQ